MLRFTPVGSMAAVAKVGLCAFALGPPSISVTEGASAVGMLRLTPCSEGMSEGRMKRPKSVGSVAGVFKADAAMAKVGLGISKVGIGLDAAKHCYVSFPG